MNKIWSLFIPHESNNHRAHLTKPSFISFLIVLYLLNQSIIKSFTIAQPGVLGYSSEITAQKVFDQTNAQRQKNGLPDLEYNETLSRSAIAKAQDMFKKDYWAHNSPDGITPWEFFKQEGYLYSIAGENLAKDFYDTDSMMKAWIASPTHRANILNSKYQEIGIGVVNGVLNGVKTTLVVQHFGTPLHGYVAKSKTVKPQVLAETTATSEMPSFHLNVSPLQISQVLGSLIFLLIIGALIIDGYFTLKNKTHRLAGSAAGHVGFLVIILILLLVNRQGAIF